MIVTQIEKPTKLAVRFGGRSLAGAKHQNQDALIVKSPTLRTELELKGVTACIADGASCSDFGQQASHTGVTQFVLDYYTTPDSWGVRRSASKVLDALNSWLFHQGETQSLNHNGLVTTLSAIIFKSNTGHIFHIGDSRIYLLRNQKLQLLTKDHKRKPLAGDSYLTRALGIDSKVDIDYSTIVLQSGDRFILTTDGVHSTLVDKDLASLCDERFRNLEDLCEDICHRAIKHGSDDNVSCLMIEITHLPKPTLLEHQALMTRRAIPPAMKVGNRIDRYVVKKVLHTSNRSHVYEVENSINQERYVLKAPSICMSEDSAYLKGFSNEYWVGQKLNSPMVMKVFMPPEDSKFAYQLCEPIKGMTLRQWMLDNPSPELAKVRNILDELIKAIRVFQRAGMVHRDLKPENIMMTEQGDIKLIDFGSTQVEGIDEIQLSNPSDLPLGDVNYIAPEYINTGSATTQSDLFSVAVIGYEMLTGELPFKTRTIQSIQSARHLKWHYLSLQSLRPDIPEWVNLTFEKACHPSMIQRYQVLSEFVTDLHTPNAQLQKNRQSKPLIKRNPILFWKSTSILLALVAFLELLALMGR
ncbi:bifunctional protein-serine/threonine kinase/phosphatase [Vibrio sp. S4M6]|uniref:bifunctional protein-serine/threonine kinase/phosphatase n=1 Tax=Vibrio sinus TaxID=2946865 RepID=UPI00202A9D66|nr:bifunctional protein-serine/threonine kinase/phosphatase [Vibrio sinus]MCL9782537.1 bifunctional protein-serine/threonine kinase/phosphatase [Vibrio sinus]